MDYQSFKQQWLQIQKDALSLVMRIEEKLNAGLTSELQLREAGIPFHGEIAEAFIRNTHKLKGVKRIAGGPYATHPTRMALMLEQLIASSPHRHESILFALFHDYLEEGDGRHAEGVALFRAEWSGNQQVVEAAIYLSEPVLDYQRYPHKKDYLEDVAYILQISGQMQKNQGQQALVNASLVDKLDNIHDLVYITGNPRYSPEKKRHRLTEKFGYFSYVLQRLRGWADPALVHLLDRAIHQQAQHFEIPMVDVLAMAKHLEELTHRYEGSLQEQIRAYHQDVLG